MRQLATVFAFGAILLTGSIFAQEKKTSTGTTRFSSVYTNLDKDCKTIKGEPEGTDNAYFCKGVGGYQMYVGYAAAATIINVLRGEERVGDIPMQSLDYDQSKIKVEWRMAGGKPFAVIIRLYTYGGEKASESDYFGKKIGEELKVIGLQGFENIDFTVDAKTPDANAKARELADNAYRQKRKN
jgi:hypothetical protein